MPRANQHFLLIAALLTAATLCQAYEDPVQPEHRGNKKGLGLAEKSGLGAAQLEALQLSWFYNWSAQTAITTPVKFVPMIFSPRSLNQPIHTDTVLGFNEPDNAKQAALSVPEALQYWPQLSQKARSLGSPAMAGNPVNGAWLPAFMKRHPKVDFVTVHWYKGIDAKKFIKDIQAVCDTYGKPVWVTEFAPSTAANGRLHPDKFSQAEVNQFIRTTVSWMNQQACVQAFAWHDAKVGSSALFDPQGALTATGKAYAQAN